ncbi:secreted RxLR effector protein 161-like [Malus domestica]|uniref:secreted RxLR effector protein 161-like n=1 Tax=Malus domestica TaxID=3750 RepID=UPI0039767854
MNTVRVLLSVVVNNAWPLFQMDVILHGDLEEEVYMKLPPGHPRENEPNKPSQSVHALSYSSSLGNRQGNTSISQGLSRKGIIMKNNGSNHILAYTDANWVGNALDRKSTTGFCTFVGGNLVTWKSKKQTVIARSSAEAEYRAMAATACELI